MKRYLLPLFGMLLMLGIWSCNGEKAQNNGEDAMSEMAEDTAFQEKHETPRTANVGDEGEMIRFDVMRGGDGRAFELKPEDPQALLLVFHEWWGLNENIIEEAQKLYDSLDNTHVLAVDLYDGRVTAKQDSAPILMNSVTEDRRESIIKGALKYAKNSGPVGTIGWCFGGGWSLKAAIIAGDRAEACVMYYGMPVKTEEAIEPLEAPVLGIFGEQDDHISPQVVLDFEQLTSKTGKDFEYEMYNADHAFANPSSPRYNDEAARDANAKALAFLRKHLPG